MDDKLKNELRKPLDELLSETEIVEDKGKSSLPTYAPSDSLDCQSLSKSSKLQSKKLIDALLNFYLSAEVIEKNEYIKYKALVDVMTMSNLSKQLQITEHAIDTLIKNIDMGEISPRLFEVLGQLQNTMLNILKHQTLHLIASEENAKKLKRDIDIYNNSMVITNIHVNQPQYKISRGTGNLMKDIQAELGNLKDDDEEDLTDNNSDLESIQDYE